MRRSIAIAAALATAFLFGSTVARAEPLPCPRPGALGTARVLAVDTSKGLFVGTKSYAETLPLRPKEVVLTFDDGPSGKSTEAVLAALAAECVKATFFVIGQQAAAHPALLKRIEGAGHTIAHHSMTHPIMTTLPFETGRRDIEAGWQTVDRILYGKVGPAPITPFFRFPGFAATPALADWLKDLGVGVFGTDLWGSDWNPMTPDALLAQVLARLEAKGGGIVLLHDIHAHTAAMVPRLLAELKARGYRVVHMVPANRPAL